MNTRTTLIASSLIALPALMFSPLSQADTFIIDDFNVEGTFTSPGKNYGYVHDIPVSDMTFDCCRFTSIPFNYSVVGVLGGIRNTTMFVTASKPSGNAVIWTSYSHAAGVLHGYAGAARNGSVMHVGYKADVAQTLGLDSIVTVNFSQLTTSDASGLINLSVSAKGIDGKSYSKILNVTEVSGSTAVAFSLAGLTSIKELNFYAGGNGQYDQTFIGGQHIAIDNISVSFSPVAVPEAQTYALMLAGLGLVGFMVRRRKQVDA